MTDKLPVFAKDMESEHFFQTFQEMIVSDSVCSCGRRHFSDNLQRSNKELFDELYAATIENPDEFCYSSVDIPTCILDGENYVLGCECHRGRMFEDLMWSSRWSVLEYFRKRAAAMQEEGVDLEDAVDKIDGKLEGEK